MDSSSGFLARWADAALTSVGFFWMALWAFCLGYTISSMIQVFVGREQMRGTMGGDGPKPVAMGALFGFISSSCSFAALSTTRALFQRGAGLAPSLAFLLASTNLVIELGIVIAIFMSWQFVVGEYVGGMLLILLMWLIVRLTLSSKLEKNAREHAEKAGSDRGGEGSRDWKSLATSREGWRRVGRRYTMEWGMVWRDVLFGFTVAGVIAAFVPDSFFRALFVGSSLESEPAWWQIVLHAFIGPAAAFFTFIGSMGNIPLAAVLFGSGVSFAGVMAFIFSDLVVFPVLRISVKYFGKRMAAYILLVFLVCLAATSVILHAAFDLLGILPSAEAVAGERPGRDTFAVDHTLFLNIAFVLVSGGLIWLASRGDKRDGHSHGGGRAIMTALAALSTLWLAGGVVCAVLV